MHLFEVGLRHYAMACRWVPSQAVYEEEQRNYYILSSFWAELDKDQVLGEPVAIRTFDMHTCTLKEVQVRDDPYSTIGRTLVPLGCM